MKKEKENTGEKNLILLILLFILISLVLIIGRFIFKNPQIGSGREQASTRLERPVISRVGHEETPVSIAESSEVPVEAPVEAVTEKPVEEKLEARLFYYWLSDSGDLTLKSVHRTLNSDQNHLNNVIEELLKGPSTADLDKGFLSLIPENSHLNQVKVVSQTVRLDFSEEFSFNPLGYEGFNAQLKQIVYTVTEFPQVTQVLFTIEGELRDYINGEGMYTGEPLSRSSF